MNDLICCFINDSRVSDEIKLYLPQFTKYDTVRFNLNFELVGNVFLNANGFILNKYEEL